MNTKNEKTFELLAHAHKLGILCQNCKNAIISKNNCYCLMINRSGLSPVGDFCSLFEQKETL